MKTLIRPALTLFVSLSVMTGLIYPLLVTGISQAVFPTEAAGSLLFSEGGKLVGSRLIGQNFTDPKYFWGRPSATGPYPNNAAASSGSDRARRETMASDTSEASATVRVVSAAFISRGISSGWSTP